MNCVEIASLTNLEYVKISINQQIVLETHNCKTLNCKIVTLPATVNVEFRPLKIRPIVRYNNFMLNYWLAGIQLFDHQLEFTITETFFQDYKNKNIQGRIDSLTESQKKLDHYWDKYVGIDNLHPEIVQKIKSLISK
jgi:hypothetical protein